MEATSIDGLAELIRLKRHLYQLKIGGELSLALYTQLNTELDFLSFTFVEDVSVKALPEFINTLAKRYPTVRFSVLDPVLTKQRVDLIRNLRQQAVSSGKEALDISSLFDHIDQLPLHRFSWRHFIGQYQTLETDTISTDLDNAGLLERCSQVFGAVPASAYFCNEKSLQKHIFRKLVMERLVPAETVEQFQQDEEVIRNALIDRERAIERCTRAVDIETYSVAERLRMLYQLAATEDIPDDFIKAILVWNGPDQYKLLHKLITSKAQSKPVAELILGLTGVHPSSEPERWKSWLTSEQTRLSAELAELNSRVNQNRLFYDILHIVSLRHLSPTPEELAARWLPIAQTIARKRRQQLESQKRQVLQTNIIQPEPKITQELEPVIVITKKSIVPNEEPEPLELDLDLDLDDIQALSAPKVRRKQTDRVVEKFSSWNNYVKPFLSENWLGLIGIGFILAAWPILSMMVWNLGEYYRLAAGAVPLLFMTFGSAWITQFFSKLNNPAWQTHGTLPDINRKPVQLFSCLTAWSLPFNVLMAVSMIDAGKLLIGVILLLVYGCTMIFIGPWLRAAFGNAGKKHLIQSHAILLLPVLFKLIAPNTLDIGLAVLVYAVVLLFAKNIFYVFKNRGIFSFTFMSLLYGGNALLGLATTHIFYHQMPAIGTLAVVCEWIALGLLFAFAYTQARSANLLIVGGALTVLGLLLGFADTRYFPILLPLSAIFWFYLHSQKQKYGTAPVWIMEVVAVHPILLAIAFYADWNLAALPSFGVAGAVVIGLWLLENVIAKQEIKVLSWGLPLAIIIAAITLGREDWSGYGYFVALIIAALANYQRACRLYHSGLWYVSVILITGLPPLFFNSILLTDPVHLTIYLAAVCLIWALGSNSLRNKLAHNHATTISWLLTAIAGISALATALISDFEWQTKLTVAMCLITLSSLLAARKSQSSLPIYFAALLVATIAIELKSLLELQSRSGLGLVIAALACVVIAPLLQSLPWLNTQKSPDRFFNRRFFLSGERYLQTPIEHCAWLLILVSMVKATLLFAADAPNIKTLAAYILQCATLIIFANRYKASWPASLALIPTTLALATLCLALPDALQPIAILIVLLIVYQSNDWIQKHALLNNVLRIPLQYTQNFLSVLFIPFAFLGYAFLVYVDAEPWQVISLSLLSLLYTQVAFINRGRTAFVHLNILHVMTLWTLVFLFAVPILYDVEYADRMVFDFSLYYVLGLFTVLFVIAYVMEWINNQIIQFYRVSAQKWLVCIALAVMPIAALSLIDAPYYGQLHYGTLTLIYSLVTLHFANRYFHHSIFYFCKWLMSWLITFLLLGDPVLSAIISSYLYLSFELIWHFAGKIKSLQLQGVGEHWKAPTEKIACVLLVSLIASLIVHGFSLNQVNSPSMNPAWLFALLPLAGLLYQMLRWDVLSYASASLFVYANIFVALQWRYLAHANGLTSLHLLSGALLFSLFCFIFLLRALPSKYRTAVTTNINELAREVEA